MMMMMCLDQCGQLVHQLLQLGDITRKVLILEIVSSTCCCAACCCCCIWMITCCCCCCWLHLFSEENKILLGWIWLWCGVELSVINKTIKWSDDESCCLIFLISVNRKEMKSKVQHTTLQEPRRRKWIDFPTPPKNKTKPMHKDVYVFTDHQSSINKKNIWRVWYHQISICISM